MATYLSTGDVAALQNRLGLVVLVEMCSGIPGFRVARVLLGRIGLASVCGCMSPVDMIFNKRVYHWLAWREMIRPQQHGGRNAR